MKVSELKINHSSFCESPEIVLGFLEEELDDCIYELNFGVYLSANKQTLSNIVTEQLRKLYSISSKIHKLKNSI